MRDIVFSVLVAALCAMALRRPKIGLLAFIWISLMTPHRYTWGFAYDFPFAVVVAACTLGGLLFTKDDVRYEPSAALWLLIAMSLWMGVTTAFALEPENARFRFTEVLKVLLFVHVSAMVIKTRKDIEALLWVMVLSVGVFGVKGGLFTLLNQGEAKVFGPPGRSFLSDNNAISIALVMIIPLMGYLRSLYHSPWIRHAWTGAMLLSGMAIVGTYSRGALLAGAAMCVFLWFKSSRKLAFGALLAVAIPLGLGLMPEKWTERMNTISNYEQDSSATGRLNSWATAINVASDRPLVGGGFEMYTERVFARYAPDPLAVHSAHSIYFQMLGEHGYVGLSLFLAIFVCAWIMSRQMIVLGRGREDLQWAVLLARSIQVSLVGYAVGGAFVNISYWELPYYLIVILGIARKIAQPTKDPALGGAERGAPLPMQAR